MDVILSTALRENTAAWPAEKALELCSESLPVERQVVLTSKLFPCCCPWVSYTSSQYNFA